MENKLTKKYGLPTAIAMVVGIVIGSGVFFKAQTILERTNNNMPLGIIAWLIGGFIMIVCALTFSVMATRYEKVNGIVDYAEVTCGSYSYYIGWFMSSIFYPCITSVLGWLSARYVAELFGWNITGGQCMALAFFLLICSYIVNAVSPKLAGKLQVSATVIKLIPLLLMAVVGTIFGLRNGTTIAAFSSVSGGSGGLFGAVVATAFAYEGWIIATTINSELKDAKKNLPKALTIGSIIVVAIYIVYYVGVAGAASIDDLREIGATVAFQNVFGNFGGTLMTVFVVISCLGTLNGLMLGCTRGMYSLAVRGKGLAPKAMSEVSPSTNMPMVSAIFGLFVCAFWLLYFFGANLASPTWFGPFCFDSSELPIVTLYAMYIPIFVAMMIKEKSLSFGKRFVLPVLSVISCLFMVVAAVYAHGIRVAFYLIVFAVIMGLSLFFRKEKKL